MICRDARLSDLPLIVEIYNSTIPSRMVTADTEPLTVDQKADWFHAHNPQTRPLWLFEEDNNVIGWASFQNLKSRPAYNGTAEIGIYLAESMRGKKYGTKLLAFCISESPRLQIHTLLGFIFAHNGQSIRLFTNAGFEEWGNLKDVTIMDGIYRSVKIFGKQVGAR